MKKLAVIGNGMVGHHFVTQAIELELHKYFEINVFSEESLPAYDRVYLSSYFEDKNADKLNLVDLNEYEQANIKLHLNAKIASLDTSKKTITTHDDSTHSFDVAVLATGSYPFVPPIPGNDHSNCQVYRTIDDLDATIAIAEQEHIKRGVVVGGGLLGLEAANALVNLGLEAHVIEFAPQLMGIQLDAAGSDLLKYKIESLGVQVHTSKNTKAIVENTDDNSVLTMQFADESHLDTDLIVFSAGIRPQDSLARQSGLAIGERGGIVIDNQCETSIENIYAIGECALWNQRIFGLVAPGYTMAAVCAKQIASQIDLDIEADTFSGADMSTKLKLLGVDVGSIGDAHAKTEGAMSFVYHNPKSGHYKKLVTDKDGDKLLGAVLVGDTEDYGNLLQLYLNEMDLPDNPESLILPNVEKPVMGVDNLPDTATICSCFNVTKGEISTAVEAGAQEYSELKATTKASTGCGGCTQMVKDVLAAELTKLGIEVNNDLCEHFPYSRQDLYSLIRVGQIKTFEELLEKHGTGHGCEICKPTAASIFASCWNEYVLNPPLAGLQDSNDYFLGNIQKDGTYSVVPRVAGGEITPEKLIVLGQVAKDFGLYTKVTGGQRVDLFGARVEQLPEIWERLIEVGFETGHAYGKSLRTAKSCVGSTWCRYGVDDSVGLAIELENRYKGLRSPHKIKMGVSGCTRECAEAQSKDVGVIATENGWNLYVCGNGGMRPRHAELFASDLDKDTLIQYIDRFLMFYIQTADKLQRTSVWREKIEGGLEYIQEVVINDSLGIAETLEAQMQSNVDNYQCEWKTTISDMDKLKRFKHFVNSKASDENIVFVQERAQIRPATINEKRV